jgi:hypothetical protein
MGTAVLQTTKYNGGTGETDYWQRDHVIDAIGRVVKSSYEFVEGGVGPGATDREHIYDGSGSGNRPGIGCIETESQSVHPYALGSPLRLRARRASPLLRCGPASHATRDRCPGRDARAVAGCD